MAALNGLPHSVAHLDSPYAFSKCMFPVVGSYFNMAVSRQLQGVANNAPNEAQLLRVIQLKNDYNLTSLYRSGFEVMIAIAGITHGIFLAQIIGPAVLLYSFVNVIFTLEAISLNHRLIGLIQQGEMYRRHRILH